MRMPDPLSPEPSATPVDKREISGEAPTERRRSANQVRLPRPRQLAHTECQRRWMQRNTQ
jgi:hypothetical protein